MVHKERELLDRKKRLEDEVKLLHQTLSFLTLTSTSGSSNPPAKAVTVAIKERKKKITETVSSIHWLLINIILCTQLRTKISQH